jgi:hypothetical protein
VNGDAQRQRFNSGNNQPLVAMRECSGEDIDLALDITLPHGRIPVNV